ncbi:hypothetical protein GCM10028807_00170 [Spirosoma daeguense]
MKSLKIFLVLLLLPGFLQAQVVTIQGITTKINSGLQVNINGDVSNATSSTLHTDGTLIIAGNLSNAGIASGSGTVAYTGSLTQTGIVSPGNSTTLGKLTVTGNYSNGTGALNIDLGAATTPGTGYDQLAVSGTATLSGALNISLVNGFSISPGQSFTILTASSISGTFATTNLPSGATLQYNPTNVQLITCLDANGAVTTLKAGNWSDVTVWSCGVVPSSTTIVKLNHVVTLPPSYVAQIKTLRYGVSGKLTYQANATLRLGF